MTLKEYRDNRHWRTKTTVARQKKYADIEKEAKQKGAQTFEDDRPGQYGKGGYPAH